MLECKIFLSGGSVPTELVIKQNKHAVTQAVALVNGFGSLGSCVEGPLIGTVATFVGWSGMYPVLIGLSAIGTLAVYKAAWMNARFNQPTPDYIGMV